MQDSLKYLKKIDMFGNDIKLSFYKEKTHKTGLGGFMTVLLILFSGIAISYFGQEIIYKRIPYLTLSESYSASPEIDPKFLEASNKESVYLAIRVQDLSLSKSLNESIFLKAFIHLEGDSQSHELVVSKMECQQNQQIENYSNFNFHEMICFSFEKKSQQENIFGNQLELIINLNEDSLETEGLMQVIFTDQAINPSSYENPSIPFLTSRTLTFKEGYLNSLFMQLSKKIFETDSGLILTSLESFSYFMTRILSSQEVGYAQLEASKMAKAVCVLNFQMDNKIEKISRSYLKLQNFLSYVGGIIKVFSIFFVFLSKKMTKIDFYMDLLNEIFNFQGEDEDEKDENENDSLSEDQHGHQLQQKNKIQKNGEKKLQGQNSMNTSKNLFLDLQNHQNDTLIPLNNIKKMNSFSICEKEQTQGNLLVDPSKVIELVPIAEDTENLDAIPFHFFDHQDVKQKEDTKQDQHIKIETLKLPESKDKKLEQKQNEITPTQAKRRGGFRNTLLISKFMHKIQSLVHKEGVDENELEMIKNRLNSEGNQYIQPENKPLKWGFVDYISNIFCIGKAYKKRVQMKYCWKKVKERLNAVYLMQKLVELEKLKILLLDEHQLKLFDYLPKPMISFDCDSTEKQKAFSKSKISDISSSSSENYQEEDDSTKNKKQYWCFKKKSKQNEKKIKSESPTKKVENQLKKTKPKKFPTKSEQAKQHAFHQQWIQLNARSTPLEKALNAMEAFQQIKGKKEKTQIDINLVDMLDERMKKCFENANSEHIKNQIDNEFGDQDSGQIHQFFDGNNTIREFLYPTEQNIFERKRANSLIVESTPFNNSNKNLNFNFNGNVNNINYNLNLNNNFCNSPLIMSHFSNHQGAFTPIRRHFLQGNQTNTNSFAQHNNIPFGLDDSQRNRDNQGGFSKYVNEYNKIPLPSNSQSPINERQQQDKTHQRQQNYQSFSNGVIGVVQRKKPSLFQPKIDEKFIDNRQFRLHVPQKQGSLISKKSIPISPSLTESYSSISPIQTTKRHQQIQFPIHFNKPAQHCFQKQLSSKQLAVSGIEFELNTIEEDIPQENNTPSMNKNPLPSQFCKPLILQQV